MLSQSPSTFLNMKEREKCTQVHLKFYAYIIKYALPTIYNKENKAIPSGNGRTSN